jgi:hypothetical protein
MASAVVEMDYDAMENIAKGFDTANDVLSMIDKALEVAIQSLRAASFVSFGTTEALAKTLEFFQKIVQNLQKVCTEFARDIRDAVRDHRTGDYKAGSYFKKGITL